MPSAAPRSPCSDLFSPSVSDAPHTRPTYVDAATLLIRGVTLAPCRYPDAMRTGVAALAAACLLILHAEMRRLHAAGMSAYRLAQVTGLAERHVGRIMSA